MKKGFLLSKENIELSKAEVLSLAHEKKHELFENLLVLEAKFDFSRLAYTKSVYDVLFISPAQGVIKAAKQFRWYKVCKKSFCIRVFNSDKALEKQIAEVVWKKLKSPEVNLDNPEAEFHFFFFGKTAVGCRLRQDISQKPLDARRAHLRPEMHPSSLHPRLARAMVNLSGAKKGKIVDPFCGTGGILIEAGLMGFEIDGYDIEDEMISRAEKNLASFGLKPMLKKQDSTKIDWKMDYVVSDLPYAKATKSQNLEKLYSEFFAVLKKRLNEKAVLGLPSFVENKKLIEDAGLKIECHFTIYVHKSLSKEIFVIVK